MASIRELAVPGRVTLGRLRCSGRHGGPRAGDADQLFFVDVSVELDLGPVARSDAYADVVDLADLATTVRQIVSGPPRLLLETVAVHAARLVLERYPRVSRVWLRLAKPEPAGLDAAEEAIEVTLDRGV